MILLPQSTYALRGHMGILVHLLSVCIITVIYTQGRNGAFSFLVQCVGFCFRSASFVSANTALHFLASVENPTRAGRPGGAC